MPRQGSHQKPADALIYRPRHVDWHCESPSLHGKARSLHWRGLAQAWIEQAPARVSAQHRETFLCLNARARG